MPHHTVAPRPILKRPSAASVSNANNAHAVHFAPLTCYFSAHSPAVYDRTPIDITPNACTLPERGCPGRTYYNVEGISANRYTSSANTKHPRAFAPCDIPASPPSSSSVPCPPLIPDFSSESEESDGFYAFPDPSSHQAPSHAYYNAKGLALNLTRREDQYPGYYPDIAVSLDSTAVAMSFLPHPPSPLTRSSYLADDDEAPSSPKPRRRRSSRSRERKQDKHDISRDLDRMRIVDQESTSESQHRGRRNKLSSRTKSSDSALSISGSFASFGLQDDGCLGGF
ncbi:hypothetical protein JOM56_011420 [Amanita muscaria]